LETQKHLFEPFFTTKGPGKGSGLGLATVYGIVSQHNAAIEVNSAPGEGTTFQIFFSVSETGEVPTDVPRAAVHRGGSERILIAEDDDAIRRLAERFLRGAGYTVVAVEDGAAALEVLREQATDFDLVMLDVIMPKIGGRAVYDFLQEHHPELPVLFASGYNAGEIHSDFVLNDGLSFIQKPYRSTELLQRIREILGPDPAVVAPAVFSSPDASGSPTAPAAARR
jgi:CheY-like chemotaxis protein